MLEDILSLLSATPSEIMDNAVVDLEQRGYLITRDPDDLFLFAVPPGMDNGNFMAPVLCAHCDVVGVIPPKKEDIVVNRNLNRISLRQGADVKAKVLGADDRAGVYALFQILSKVKNNLPFVVLTDKEEVGGIGAGALTASGLLDEVKNQITCFIEFDRSGVNDIVSYDASGEPNKALGNMFFEQGFRLAHGSYSDVADFTAQTNISSVNLSVGYYHEHSKSEVLFMDELELTITRVARMWIFCHDLFGTQFEQEEGRLSGSFDSFWPVFGAQESKSYAEMLDVVYDFMDMLDCDGRVEATQNDVTDFLKSLTKEVVAELVTHLEDVVEDISYSGIACGDSVSEWLVKIIMVNEDESEVEVEIEIEIEEDFGMYVDQRGAIVCGKQNRVGCY